MGNGAVWIGAFYIQLHTLAAPAEEKETLWHSVRHYKQAVAALKLSLKMVAAIYAAMRTNPPIIILKAFQRVKPCQLGHIHNAVLNNGINSQSGMRAGVNECLEPAGFNAQPLHLGLEVGALALKFGGSKLESLHLGSIFSSLGLVQLNIGHECRLVAVQPFVIGLELLAAVNGTASNRQQCHYGYKQIFFHLPIYLSMPLTWSLTMAALPSSESRYSTSLLLSWKSDSVNTAGHLVPVSTANRAS